MVRMDRIREICQHINHRWNGQYGDQYCSWISYAPVLHSLELVIHPSRIIVRMCLLHKKGVFDDISGKLTHKITEAGWLNIITISNECKMHIHPEGLAVKFAPFINLFIC